MRLSLLRPALFLAALAAFVAPAPSAKAQVAGQAPATSDVERVSLHQSSQWQLIEPHLPNPTAGTAAQLETAGDVLRARRFPEDALDYYGYAMARGGNVSSLLNKMGIVRLELRQNDLARQMFLRTVAVRKKDAQAWNNLGVVEYADHHFAAALADYKRAAKFDKHTAVYHSNMGMAYFEMKDVESARGEFAAAIKMDPHIMQSRDGGGSTAHVLGSQNYPELCFEMARMYAREHETEAMLLWLGKASEGGYDVRDHLKADYALSAFARDPRVVLLLMNADHLKARNVAAAKAPSLGPSSTEQD